MVYLEYEKKTGRNQVIEIYDKEPGTSEDYDYAKTESFLVGDEFEHTIWINEVDEDRNLLSHSAIRNNPNAKRLLEENVQLKAENEQLRNDLNDAVMELSMLFAMGGKA